MSWSEIIKLLGIVSSVLLITTFSLGLFKFKIKDRLKLHKIAAYVTLVVALTHGSIVVYRTYFMNGFDRFFNP